MKLGTINKFYFDFFCFLKQLDLFKNNDILIYSFENFTDIDIALLSDNIDIALTSSSILSLNEKIESSLVFVKNAFKIFGIQNGLDKLRDKDALLKVGIPQKNSVFKNYFYSFYKFFYGKSEKIQWLQIDDSDVEIFFEQNLLDFLIVYEPLTFDIIGKSYSTLLVHKNRYEIPLLFANKKEKIDNEKLSVFKNSIIEIKRLIREEKLLYDFIKQNKNKYLNLQNYIDIFSQNFQLDHPGDLIDINLFQKENQNLSINEDEKNNIKKSFNINYFNKEESISVIRNELNKITQYMIKLNSDCNVGILPELINLKILVDKFMTKEKMLKLKIYGLEKKNKILLEDLENGQQTLSDLFMQFRTTSENLLIKNIQVQESMNEKNRLIATLSHDLKTPLTGILGIAEQLLIKESDDEKKNKLSIILESGNTLLQLINNILENAKDISISKKLDKKIFNLKNIAKTISENIKIRLKGKQVKFNFDYDDAIPQIIIGDPLKINQILYNLLGNSAKFTNQGFIELKIDLLENQNDLCKIMIQVKDSGIGISEDKIDHIFEPFVQEDDRVKEKFGGTGLGLSIVKDYVELMGGTIECRSKKNKGTIFTIILSFDIPQNIGEKEENLAIEKIHKLLVFKQSKILILEDNLINQEILKGYLGEYHTLKLEFKENGEEGLKELKNENYDIIMSDIVMPVMDGIEFCTNFRKIDKSTPLIAMTASDREEEVNNLLKIGFNSVIPKPYKKEDLIQGLMKYLPVEELKDNDDKKLIELEEKAKNSSNIDKFKKLFLEDLKNRYFELKNGIMNKDKEKLRYFSHNLKGIAPTLGFPEFAELAERASLLYKEDRWEELYKIRDEFLDMVDKISEKL